MPKDRGRTGCGKQKLPNAGISVVMRLALSSSADFMNPAQKLHTRQESDL